MSPRHLVAAQWQATRDGAHLGPTDFFPGEDDALKEDSHCKDMGVSKWGASIGRFPSGTHISGKWNPTICEWIQDNPGLLEDTLGQPTNLKDPQS